MKAALEVLRSTGIDVLEAALVAKEALECGRGRVKRARTCIQLGAEQLKLREKTVTFAKAVETALEDRKRKGLRARSIVDFRYLCRRLMKMNPELAERRMRSITSEDCRRYLGTAYGGSVAQYRKARAILSGVFSTAIRHEWCDANPVSRVEVPEMVETPITALDLDEVAHLEKTARQPEHQDMQLSLHLMLYCGIRPTEVSRINPETDIDWEHAQVLIRPTTSKTGGGRVVPLRKAGDITVRTIPRLWVHRWRALRKAAGWSKENAHPWRPDVCRHTFATYHAAHFRNFAALQVEMGHRDSNLLRTRYVYAGKTNEAIAARFFRDEADTLVGAGRAVLDSRYAEWYAQTQPLRLFALDPAAKGDRAPSILIPANGATVLLDPNLPANGSMVELKSTLPAATTSWRCDSLRIIREGNAWYAVATPGTHTIHATDSANGLHAQSTINVRQRIYN